MKLRPTALTVLLFLAAWTSVSASAEEAAAPAVAASSAAPAAAQPGPAPSPPVVNPASGKSLRDRLDFAKGLYARDMYDMALDEYEAILKESAAKETTAEALLGAGESLFFLKRYAQAREHFTTYVDRNPESADADKAKLRIGETLLYEGEKQESFTVFHGLRGAQDDDVRTAARYYEGKISFDQGYMNAAATHFREVIDAPVTGPYKPFARYYLGEVLLAQELPADAEKLFAEAAKTEDAGIRQLALMGGGKALAAQNRHAEAADLFGSAAEMDADPAVAQDAVLNHMNSLVNAEKFEALLKASEALKGKVTDSKKQVEFKLLAAKGLSRSGQKDAAQGVYREVMKAEGLKPEETKAAKLGVAQNMIAQGQAEEALEFLASEDAQANLAADEIAFLRAEAFRRLGRRAEAAVEYARIAGQPESNFRDEAMLAVAYLHSENGEFREAADAFRAFIGAYPGAELTPKAFSDLILAEIKMKDYVKAIEDSQRFLDRYPTGAETQKVHLRMAGLYTESGRYELASEVYDNHVRRFEGSVNPKEIEMLRAANAQRSGDTRAALKIYRKISAKDVPAERYAELLKNRAFGYVTLGSYPLAAQTYLDLFRHYADHANDPEAYLWTADVFAHAGSAAKLQETMELFGKKFGADARPVEMTYYRAESDRLSGRLDEAVAGYDRVLTDGGTLSARAAMGKGLALAKQGNGAAAEAALEEALKLSGEDHRLSVRVRMQLGQMYLESRNYKEAAKTFFAVAILYDDPETVPEALWGAGQAFEKAKDTEKASQAYRELTERYPQHARVKEANQRLKALL